jgi:hypothetical protein
MEAASSTVAPPINVSSLMNAPTMTRDGWRVYGRSSRGAVAAHVMHDRFANEFECGGRAHA